MKILILGNGFDLAHGLPTTYEDFLEFMSEFADCYDQTSRSGSAHLKPNGRFAKYIKDIFLNKKGVVKELNELSRQNLWLKHFQKISLEQRKAGRTGWIDFEGEISDIVQTMENARELVLSGLKTKGGRGSLNASQTVLLEDFFLDTDTFLQIESFDTIKNNLVDDLNKLIRCLEIYLAEVVEKNPVTSKQPDIEKIDPDFVLSFNYTDTYQRVYRNDKNVKQYCYIHGKADIAHTVDTCNLILGIDEYLNDYEKNEKTEFIQFKKFFQRIYKKTGSEYREWINCKKRMEKDYGVDCDVISIFVFGHSLDATDKDILKFLIDRPESRVSIFYHNRKTQGDLIANMVKLIGQEMLINRTYGKDAQVSFLKQSEY